MKFSLHKLNITNFTEGLFASSLVGIFLLLLPFQAWTWVYFATQTSKVLFLGWSVVFFITIGGMYSVYFTKRFKLTITKNDLLLGLFFLYSMIHVVWVRPVKPDYLFVLQWLGLAILYVLFRTIQLRQYTILILLLMLGASAQAVYGNLQLFGFCHSNHNLFKVTGSFFNPGPYSGYLVSVFPVALGILLFSKSSSLEESLDKHEDKRVDFQAVKKYIALICVVTILLILPAGGSRVAFLSLLGSTLYLLSAKEKVHRIWEDHVQPYVKKWVLYIIITITIIASVVGLYIIKKGSADGRLLIWKITTIAIIEQPLWGHGIDKFKSFYMDYQAKYFGDNHQSSETIVAGDIVYPFNEPLRIASETGLIGLAIVMLVFFYSFQNNNKNANPHDSNNLALYARAGLISILIFSCFSYPLEIVPIMVNVFLYLAIVARSQKSIFEAHINIRPRNPFMKLMLAFLLFGIVLFVSEQLYRINEAYTQWENALYSYNMRDYDLSIKGYEKIYPMLKHNGTFLINYGKALSMAGHDEEAIRILKSSEPFLNNTILYTTLGDSYKAKGLNEKAEAAYTYASQMVPSRFYPKYLLAKLYDETGQHEKAVSMANELLIKEVKVESKAIDEIKEEMGKIIKK